MIFISFSVCWLLCGLLAWWLGVRHVDKKITPTSVLMLPLIVVTGLISMIIVAVHLPKNTFLGKPFKEWKDEI